ncbi:B12-binding domain-containing radical SAM protein [Desulfothermus naphthae]
MRCVVAVPPIEDFYYTPHRGSFLGAHIVNSILKEQGHKSHLICFPNLYKKPKKIPLPKELSYLSKFIIKNETGPISFFSYYKRFGPDYRDAAYMVYSYKPNIIFISCFAFCYAKSTIHLAEEIKKIDQRIEIILGGTGPSIFPDYFKDTGLFDKIIIGQAEYALTNFLGIPKKDRPVVALVKTKTTNKWNYYSSYLTKGCPRNCKFCSIPILHGRKLEIIDKYILKNKIKTIEAKKGIFLNFEDDNVLYKWDFFVDILKSIKNINKHIKFSCENGIDYRLLDDIKLNQLINLGFRQFNFSIGTTSKKIALEQNRSVDIPKLKFLTQILDNNQIDTIVYFISGFPKERVEDAVSNLILLNRLGKNVRIGLSLFYPIPGIAGFEDKEMFKNISPVLLCSSSAWPWNNSLSTEDMITLFRLVRLVNLTKRKNLNSVNIEVIKKSFKDKKLYTFVKGKGHPVEVSCYNKDMVKLFFDGINEYLWS